MDLEELQDSFVFCRTYGHSWDEFTPLTPRSTIFIYVTHLRCTRCTTERHDSESSFGDVVQREYRYPDGYNLAEKLMRADFRIELRRRRSMQRRKRA